VVPFVFAILCLIWSTTWTAIRICEQGFTPLWGAAGRFGLASVLLVPIALWVSLRRPIKAKRGAWWMLVAAGAVNALSYGLIYLAEQRITGGTAAVLAAAHPFFAMGAAVSLGYEPLRLRRLAGLVLGLAGVALLMWGGLRADRGTALSMAEVLFAAALLWPAYTVLLRGAGDRGIPVLQVTTGFLGFTAIGLVAAAALVEGVPHPHPSARALGALVYLALVGSVAAWGLFNWLMRRMAISLLSTLVFIEPTMALGVDWLVGERAPRPTALLGSLLILGGVLLVALRGEGSPPPRLETAETG
jgi:drug/metabolite transporter (DMT)-like permease